MTKPAMEVAGVYVNLTGEFGLATNDPSGGGAWEWGADAARGESSRPWPCHQWRRERRSVKQTNTSPPLSR